MHKVPLYLILLLSMFFLLSCTKKIEEYSSSKLQNDVIYQYSTRDILFNKKYDGTLNFARMRKYGNFGLGTFNGLDGEMICIDGNFLKINGDSRIIAVDDKELSPFVTLKFFQIDTTITIKGELNLQETYLRIAENIDENLMAAISITGKFGYLKGRSIDKQSLPYPPIKEVAASQNVFEFNNVEGTLIGFKFPETMANINFPGFHFHFVTKDRDGGGHVLDFRSEEIKVDIDFCNELKIEFIKD